MQFDDPTISQQLAIMREENKPAATKEQIAYKAALADSVIDWQESQAEQRKPIEQAVSNFAAETAGKSLHDARWAEPAANDPDNELKENQGQPDYDLNKAAGELGLDAELLRKQGISTHSDVRSVMAQMLPRLAKTVTPQQLHAVLNAPEIDGKAMAARISQEIENWRSIKYGQKNERSTEQNVAVQTLVAETLKHVVGIHRAGGRVPNIETALRRSRMIDDPENYQPGTSHAPSRLPSRAFGNIHELYRNNPY